MAVRGKPELSHMFHIPKHNFSGRTLQQKCVTLGRSECGGGEFVICWVIEVVGRVFPGKLFRFSSQMELQSLLTYEQVNTEDSTGCVT